MEKVKAFADWLTKWFTVIVIVWAVFNYFVPAASLWGKAYTGYMLGIVLFGMGLTLTLDDFKRILTQPLMVIVGTVAHFIIMPLIAVALCAIFHLSGPLAVGVILVGCCPSGTSSNVMSYLSRGDVALDVSIGILSTLCAPFMIPLLMQLLASQYVSVPTQSLFLNAVKVVLFPIALGVICHMIFGKKIEKVTVALPIVSQVAILLIIYGRPAYRFSGGYSAYHLRSPCLSFLRWLFCLSSAWSLPPTVRSCSWPAPWWPSRWSSCTTCAATRWASASPS